MRADPRRRAALQVLLAVERGDALESALASVRRRAPDRQMMGAVEEFVRGALQWRARYAFLVEHFSRRGANADPVARGVLHLALHELLAHDTTPPYATIHQAGELMRAEGKRSLGGYVNAVLQSVNRHTARGSGSPLEEVRPLFASIDGDVERLAAWWSYPGWLVDRWLDRFGADDAEALLAHQNRPAPITVHVLPGHDVDAARRHLSSAGLETVLLEAHPRALEVQGRVDRDALAAALAGRHDLLVQDAGAQALLDWLTDGGALLDGVGPVVDLCAAPGGKTAHLRSLLGRERLLVAMDLRPRRVRRLRENIDRLGLRGTPALVGDGLRPPLKPGAVDGVLLDGPCSGTGVMRHHPEGRWRVAPEMLKRNQARLVGLATAAADVLRPGGTLYYATCSLEPEENEDVMAAVLEVRPDLEPAAGADGAWRRTWLPWRSGTDGFFAARLRRAAGG